MLGKLGSLVIVVLVVERQLVQPLGLLSPGPWQALLVEAQVVVRLPLFIWDEVAISFVV